MDTKTAIRLKKPHTHANRDYDVDNVITLAEAGLDPDSAAWLVAIGTAEWLDDTQPTSDPI